MDKKQYLESLYKILREHSNFDIKPNVAIFLDTVDLIVEQGDPSCISELIKYPQRDSDYTWLSEIIGSAIEEFKDPNYTEEILKNLEFLLNNYPEWMAGILVRTFNYAEGYTYFKKRSIEMSRQDPHFREILLNALDVLRKEFPDDEESFRNRSQKIDTLKKLVS